MWMASFIVYCWMNAAGMTQCSEDRPMYEDGSPATHLHTSEVQCQRHMLHDATQSAGWGTCRWSR